MLKFNNKRTPPKLLYNIGALMDIPTGTVVTGSKGESIVNGGLGAISGIVGAGNNYKSTILHYMMLAAAEKVLITHDTAMLTYDTEINISLDRLENLASNFKKLPEDIITGENAKWATTDKSLEPANVWAMSLNEYVKNKQKDKSLIVEYNAFKDPYNKGCIKAPLTTFVEIDSLTEFEPESTTEMLTKDLDSSDTNTFAMRQGLFKTKFLSQLPRLSTDSNTNFLLTAHIGEKIDMATGPAKYNQPTKKLQFLKGGDAIKGVTSKFFFLLNNAWFAHTASVLKNQGTKKPEYPLRGDDEVDTDLNTVKLTMLRSKSGPSGYTIELVVSQSGGVLPTLTEFHHIKNNGRFGLEGSNISYNMILYPDVKLGRTTVRRKIDADPKLRRAINITSELLQAISFYPWLTNEGLNCTPKELYDDLIALGYDWDVLLNTRGYWLIDNYTDKDLPFLSVIDLLKMRKGIYKPYWYKEKLKGG